MGGEFPTEIPAAAPKGEFRAFLRWRRQRKALIRAHKARGERLPAARSHADPVLRDARDSVTWAGHASVIHRLDATTVLSDPIWSRRALVIPRLSPAAPPWDEVPPADIVTLSHNHYDHLDVQTVKRMRKTSAFCVPRGDKRWFDRRRFQKVHEFDWWETQDLEGLQVTFVPSRHFSGRTPWDRNRSLWGSWVLKGKHRTIYHAGDTGYFDGFQEIGSRFPRIDVACLPVGAYEPRWFMRPFHVNPEEAGQAFLDLKARAFLPIHWGTFRLSDEAMDEPPIRIRSFFETQRLDADRLLLPDLGQTIPLDKIAQEP